MPYLTMKAACKYMSLSRPVLVDMARDGRIPVSKVLGRWRFSQEALDQFMADNRTNSPQEKKGENTR